MNRTIFEYESRFYGYLDMLAEASGHQDRHKPLRNYIMGLCLPGKRKSIEPMAARVDSFNVRARHQSMHHFVANAPWDDIEPLRVARNQVLEQMERHGGVAGWLIDDTGMPKKGNHSVGVARQYCGVLGKQENCQVAVSLSIANEAASIPVAYRLYLPESWAGDDTRRRRAGVPEDITFHKKWEIALEQVAWLRDEGVPDAPVIADAGYGNVTEFRDKLTEMKSPYVVGIHCDTTVWLPGMEPLKPTKGSGRGRPPVRLCRNEKHRPIDVMALAKRIPTSAWHDLTWREGTKGKMHSRFAVLRVRPAHNDFNMHEPRPEEWLLIEWPKNESAPTKFWLSTMPPDTSIDQLIRLAKMRWRIERDYQELKDEFGLDHYEGRCWRGFHHHATLCIAAYAFVAAERARLSPPQPLSFLKVAPLPRGFKPRGSPCPT